MAKLGSVDEIFPMHLWDWLLNQADRTLYLPRPTKITPTLSSYSMIQVIFDFNRTPKGPPGCNIIVHEKPGKRGPWEYYGVPRFYIEPFINVYCTYNI